VEELAEGFWLLFGDQVPGALDWNHALVKGVVNRWG
jgi:hypothetical protein